ncbi:MAG: Asp-tRNA(Asn)/Glu-tRNA(Gln) amidotransferase subunit GatC [Candidatus Pacebacteria bacterium]|nr:Asp-tRNA(Asn)/Glu-tRNA(Gln) amidotransferase subunit GatC [Candidatus Paceibacterota bacterium]MDQ5922589.1 aspartyl-tRNA(Asn)/glutamyl-tRNA(Gln) amidotransferase subunit [Patescibacteria group bacterium]
MEIKDVEKLAELARLDLSEEEKKTLLKDLDGVLAYVKTIEEAQIDDTEIELENYNAWREDQVRDRDFSSDLLTGQFPEEHDGFLKVKKIL